ncbi:hypothetical protein BJX99DRAFT_159529 [Aspergillus californicus]
MTSAFSFGFSGDDIDIDDVEIDDVHEPDTSGQNASGSSRLPDLVPAERHEMDEWLSTFPSQISYNKCLIRSASFGSRESTESGQLAIARRDVFDIRAQLMAEDGAEEENGKLIAGLEEGDITPNFYEGGFKTWECSIDLAGLVVGTGALEGDESGRHVVELGAGTAVPSLALFAQLLSRTEKGVQSTSTTATETRRRIHFTFADYNSAVLRLVTLPNLLLTWNHITTHRNDNHTLSSESRSQPEGKLDKKEKQEEQEEFLDITPELISSFQNDLLQRGITVDFISGAWSPSFVELVFTSPETTGLKLLVLASETIYSPGSLVAFSETLVALLRRSASRGSQALLAAKKVYFGVGGGVDEFLAVLRTVSGSGDLRVEERMDVKSEGVGRVILEIGVEG